LDDGEHEVASGRAAAEDDSIAVDGEVIVVDDGEYLRDGVFVGYGEFVLGRFAVVDADDDAVGVVGEVASDGVVCGGVVD